MAADMSAGCPLIIWNEVFARVEFSVSRTLAVHLEVVKCAARELLARSTDRRLAVVNLENALVERDIGLSFDKMDRKSICYVAGNGD